MFLFSRPPLLLFLRVAGQEVIEKYGTADCRAIALGGGPFVLQDSEDLCEEVLRRLGRCSSRFICAF